MLQCACAGFKNGSKCLSSLLTIIREELGKTIICCVLKARSRAYMKCFFFTKWIQSLLVKGMAVSVRSVALCREEEGEGEKGKLYRHL